MLLKDAEEPTVVRTEEAYTVTIAGDDVVFTADELNASTQVPDGYWKESPDGAAFLRPSGSNDTLEHFGIWQYGQVLLDDTSGTTLVNEWRFVSGEDTASMPVSGEASYDGRMFARSFLLSAERAEPTPLSTRSAETTWYRGDFGMTAEFGQEGTSLSGRIDRIESRPGNESVYGPPVDGAVTFTARTTGNRFQATGVEATGPFAGFADSMNIRGGFFGPEADETGGVFDGESSDRLLTGQFWAKKE